MNQNASFHSVLLRRERFRDWYLLNKDPIHSDRLMWQASGFRHLVHLLPGETILELGAGEGYLTKSLFQASKGRNPITAVRFDAEKSPFQIDDKMVESLCLDTLPGDLKGRKFTYVVGLDILDREDVTMLLNIVHELLEDGGRAVFFESNPWNPFVAIKNFLRKVAGKRPKRSLVSRPELYELISEVGFTRVAALFTDFVYAPLTPKLIWLLRNLSIILENMPFIRRFAGRILIHAQKPPINLTRKKVSLFRHETLRSAVSVVIPCHNEEMNVVPLVEGLRGYYDEYIHQIILVDDNSTDDTSNVMDKLSQEDPRIVVVKRTPPNGVGLAIKDGYAKATGKYVLSMDCDFQHLLPELEEMFDAAAQGFDAVLGSRFSRHSLLINYPFAKIFANRAFHLLANLIFRPWKRDVTNNLKLMRSEVVRDLTLTESWFAVNAEIGLQLVLMGCSIKEVPISWINRTFEMGHSTFSVLQSGGGYARVLGRLALKTRFGYKPIRRSNI